MHLPRVPQEKGQAVPKRRWRTPTWGGEQGGHSRRALALRIQDLVAEALAAKEGEALATALVDAFVDNEDPAEVHKHTAFQVMLTPHWCVDPNLSVVQAFCKVAELAFRASQYDMAFAISRAGKTYHANAHPPTRMHMTFTHSAQPHTHIHTTRPLAHLPHHSLHAHVPVVLMS
jgi:hypothetical protein